MSFFKKNPNEKDYTGGKKHFRDVIKDEGPENLLVWRHPAEDFNSKSVLSVMPGEQAIFVNKGHIEAVFQSGRYPLSTQNYPFLSRLPNAFTGGISTFHCVVYFFRAAHSAEIRWGTDTPIQVRDPYFGIQTSIQARGAYRACVQDPVLFLEKLIGSRRQLATADDLADYFASQFQQHIRAAIAGYVQGSGQDVLSVCARQDILANDISAKLQPAMAPYGIRLVSFSIAAIGIPDNDPNRKRLEAASAQNVEMNMMGQNWDKIQQYRLLHEYAASEGLGNAAARLGAQAGIGAAAAGATMGIAGNLIGAQLGQAQALQQAAPFTSAYSAPATPASPQPKPNQESCAFRQSTLHETPPSQGSLTKGPENVPGAQENDPLAALQKLRQMLELGLIPQEAYQKKMQEILDRI